MQQDGNNPVAEDSAVRMAVITPCDSDGDGDDDDDAYDDEESRPKEKWWNRAEPARAPTADDGEDDAISSPGHPIVRLSAQVLPRRCSRLHPL